MDFQLFRQVCTLVVSNVSVSDVVIAVTGDCVDISEGDLFKLGEIDAKFIHTCT